MSSSLAICITQIGLERRHYALAGRFSAKVLVMNRLAGKHNAAFPKLKQECDSIRFEVASLDNALAAHRREHRC